ncbi:hypothetical protein AEGHOMDF_3543 [Methylobacterium soli]|nr:hypothetical protein AEGHOMDF_3543 [Methylobacterium soli]
MLIALTVCFMVGQRDCVHERISLTDVKSPIQCVTTAQTVIAQWMAEHYPDRRVSQWKCTTPDRLDRNA